LAANAMAVEKMEKLYSALGLAIGARAEAFPLYTPRICSQFYSFFCFLPAVFRITCLYFIGFALSLWFCYYSVGFF
jgi:hypothetical protein